MVVVESNSRRLGLVVDGVLGTTEAVVKPLPSAMRSLATYSGVTILPDGDPILIVDVAMLATTSGIATDDVVDEPTGEDRSAGPVPSLLLARGFEGAHLALALADVRRLELFDSNTIERHGRVDVVRYRDGILPLLWVDHVLSGRAASAVATLGDTFEAVVCDSSVGAIGLVVGRIEDIVDEPVIPSQPPSRRGVVASFVLDDRVAELVDLEALIADAGLVTTA